MRKFFTLFFALAASVGISWALTPLSGDAWDESTKTLTVNADPGKNGYKNITEIEHVIITDGVTSLANGAFYGCTSLTSVTLPSGLTTIGNDAFRETSLASVSLPSGLISIGNNAFNQCTSLASVTFPEGLETIGIGAFSGCPSLTSVTLPESLTTVNVGVFSGCTSLASVTILAPSLSTYGKSVFYGTASGLKIYVPAASVDTYKAGWSDYASLIEAIGGGDAPDGALSGAFTINADGDKIVFSKGNLQATTTDLGTNWTWDFAPNQWSLIGNAVANNAINGNKTVSANGTVDLFGWSTAATYYGINKSWNNNDYAGDFVDWGALMGTEWRTLSRAEFRYIVFDRAQAYYKQGKATVNGVSGYIFLPDEWELPSGLSFTPSPGDYTTNQYDGADWTAMESAGAVFLPAAGDRSGTDIYMYDYGWYWTSTSTVDDKAYYLYFYEKGRDFVEHNRYDAKSVRLVTEAPIPPYEAAIKLINEIGEVTYTAECKAKIDTARTAYDALSDGDKAQVTNLTTLTDAEAAYAQLLAQAVKAVKDQIDALPATPLTDATKKLSEYNKVLAARKAYDALSDEEKAAVTNYDKLTAAEAAFAAIGGGGGSAPDGALSGAFTIDESNVVYFSKGNLQATYDGSAWSWAFAANQWDYVGNAAANTKINGNGTVSENGTVDLFGWVGASSEFVGLAQYGITTSDATEAIDGYGNNASDALKSDWGTTMGEGWFTLSTEQWQYLFNTRLTGTTVNEIANARYTEATINSDAATPVNGIILFPENASLASVTGVTWGAINETSGWETTCTTAGWTALEEAGCVFLPAAGRRYVTSVFNAGSSGYYWSSSPDPSNVKSAYDVFFRSAEMNPANYNFRSYGYSVRLVTEAPASPLADAQAAKEEIDAIPQPVVYTPECGAAIKAAREAVDALGANASLLDDADLQKLTDAEAAYAQLLAQAVKAVKDQIDALPATPLTDATKKLSEYNKVLAARKAYDALSDAEKAAVDNYDKLTAAEAAFAAIPSVGSETVITWDKNTGIEKMSGTATSPAYEGITISIKGGGFGPQDDMLRFNIAGLGLSFEFANTLGGNFQKIVISSTNAMPSTPLAGMGEGWAASSGNKIATWTGDAATVKIWDGLTATSYWDVNTIQFTLGATVSATEAAQAALDKINAIPSPVVLSDECNAAIKAAREAVTALGENASLLDDADIDKLAKAEADFALLIKDATAVVDLIDAIGEVTFSAESKGKIVDARNAYEALSDELKPYVSNYATLTAAETTYANLKDVAVAEAKINNIPQPVTLKLATRDSIESARAAYDALTADQKLLVSNYDVLTAAEATWAGLINVAPAGALSGKYTINDGGDVIYFAHGNLQYTRENLDADWSTGTFRLAENQYDLIELVKSSPNSYCTDNYGDKTAVGLFGWGTWGEGKTPNLTSSDRTLYTWSTDFSGTLEGTDTWRTLTKDEWVYLLAHNNQSYATVHGVNGLLVAPDGKDIEGKSMTAWVEINDETWTTMQNDGYLFLPACGQRSQLNSSANIITGSQGEDVVYYSSTQYSDVYAYNIWYKPGQDPAADDYSNKRQAFGIRLVSAGVNPLDQVQVVKGLIDAIPDPVTLDDACVNAIQSARDAYDALDTDAKAILDAADVKKLTDAEATLTALNQAEADEVIAKINNIPTPVELKLATRDSIESARAAYDALNAAQQALVTNYQTLLDAEAALASLNPGGGMPAGVLSGKFTINADGDQISFAKGNLQATTTDLGANWTWGFAANQWDYLGIDVANSKINGNGTVSENGTVDLFGWSTAATYYGINNSYKAVDYIGDFVDWGPNMGAGWRTLTKDEWNYLIENNTKGRAAVNDKNGYIFLPDNWSGPAFTPNPDNFTTNVYSGDDWTAMENAGAVFLPSGPARNGTYALIAMDAKYCSSTSLNNDTSYVFTIYYNQSQSACTGTNRAYGCMVRLVTEGGSPTPLDSAQAVKDLIDAIPTPVEFPTSGPAIAAALNAYDALSDAAKGALDAADVQKLTDAAAAYEAARPFAPITTAPAAVAGLKYTGAAQALITAGEVEHGTLYYSLDGENWSEELPTAIPAGAYTVYYKVTATDDYKDVAPQTIAAAIAKADIDFAMPAAVEELAYSAEKQALISAGECADGTFQYKVDENGTWVDTLPKVTDAGTYQVYYKIQGDANHNDHIAAEPLAVSIAKAALTITAENKEVVYGYAAPGFSVSYSGLQGSDLPADVLTGELSYACDYTVGSNVASYDITPSGQTSANYDITYVKGTLVVYKADPAFTEPVANTLTYNGGAQTLIAAGTTEHGTFEYTFTPNDDESWSTALPQAKNADTYGVYYRVVGDANHNDYESADAVVVTIAKAVLTATADNKEVIYGDAVPTYTVTYAGWQGADDASVLTGTIAYDCAYAPTSNVGNYTIAIAGVDAANYAITFVNGKVTVNQAALTITADDKTVEYGEQAPAFTASYEGWKNSDDATVVSGLTLTSEYLVTSNIGTYDIVPANATATNYAITFVKGTLTVNQAPLTITAEDKTMIYGDEHPEFTATYAGWKNSDDAAVVSGLAYSTPYKPGSAIGTYAIEPNSATAQNYAITFVNGTLTVNKAVVSVSGAEAQVAKFADGHAGAVVLNAGQLNGIKLNDPIAHVTTATFSSADVAENLTITLFYELTGDAALLANYDLQPTSEVFSNEGVIIEPFIPDDDHQPGEGEQVTVEEGIDVYAYGYCDGSGYSLKYHLNSGNPDQYKIDFDDARFTDVDWTNLVNAGKDGTIDIEIPVDMPTGDYSMTVYFRDSRFDWLESRALTVSFHVNLPETYVTPLFGNVIALVDTCECFTDIQWYHRNNSSEPWQPIEGATGHYYHVDGKLTGEYFVSAKMNGQPTYTCGQDDMETLYGADNAPKAQVKAFPNPVVNTTTVTIEGSDNNEHKLRIVNLMGSEMINTTFEGNETIVNMSGYIQGNYMISVDGIVVKVMKK